MEKVQKLNNSAKALCVCVCVCVCVFLNYFIGIIEIVCNCESRILM